MPKIVPIVEGPGDVKAVPNLLHKIFSEMQRWDVQVDLPINAGGCSNITRKGGIEGFVGIARNERKGDAVLVLLDADDNCPLDIAARLTTRLKTINVPVPVVIVIANCEYEAWFLASLATIAGQDLDGRPGIPSGITFDNPESKVSAKGWISQQLPGSRVYKERLDQLTMTRLIDTSIARKYSRSFQRLCHAVEEAVAAIDAKLAVVTPMI